MSASAREVVLGRVRAAIAGSRDPGIERNYRGTAPADIDLFVDRLIDYRATVHRCRPDEIPAVVAAALESASIRRLVLPEEGAADWLPNAGRAGLEVVTDDGSLTPFDLDGEDVAVITGCALAIAQTGTIVLDAGPGQGRRLLTLVPDHHICVVGTRQVVGSVPEAIGRLDPSRPLTWISGPSATSDIELRRVEGVHGPRHLVVVVVDDLAPDPAAHAARTPEDTRS